MKLTSDEAERLWKAANVWDANGNDDDCEALMKVLAEIRQAHEPKSIWWCELHLYPAWGPGCKECNCHTKAYGMACNLVEYVPKVSK